MNKKTFVLIMFAILMFTLGVRVAVAGWVSLPLDEELLTFLPFVVQNQSEGEVLSGVYAYCSNTDSSIHRSFNNVNSESIAISDGDSLGYCSIDFGFDISERYIIVTVTHPDTPLGVSISSPPTSGDSANFFVWHAGNGAAVAGGSIFVMVY